MRRYGQPGKICTGSKGQVDHARTVHLVVHPGHYRQSGSAGVMGQQRPKVAALGVFGDQRGV